MTQKVKKERNLQTCQKATQISTSLCFLFHSWSWTAGSCLKSQWEFLKFPPFSKESCPLPETLHLSCGRFKHVSRKGKREKHMKKAYVQFDEYKRKPPCKWIQSTCLSLLNWFSSSWLYIPNPSKLLSAHPSIKLEFPGPSLQCTSPISTMRKQLSTSTSSPHALPRMLLGFHDSGGPGGTGPSLVLQQRGRTGTDVAWQESIVKNHSFWVKLETIYKNMYKYFVQSIDL